MTQATALVDGAVLRVDSASFGYGKVTVVRDVTLSLAPGQVVALLGPNGAGKTTLLRGILGLAARHAGTLSLGGARLAGRAPDDIARRGICYVPEGRAIYRSLEVEENLRCFALGMGRSPNVGHDVVYEVFPILGERRRQLAGTLSGGQQQMLALSRAIISGSPLLLIDELSLGLAPVVIDELYEVLQRLNREGHGILLVEQYAHRALAVAEAVYVLAKGEIVFAGEPPEVDDEMLGALYTHDVQTGAGISGDYPAVGVSVEPLAGIGRTRELAHLHLEDSTSSR